MTETTLYGKYEIISTIAGPSLLLSSKIELFATVVKGFQLYFRCSRQPISTFDYNVWQQKKFTWRKQLSSSSNQWQFMEVDVYTVIVKSDFTRGSRI